MDTLFDRFKTDNAIIYRKQLTELQCKLTDWLLYDTLTFYQNKSVLMETKQVGDRSQFTLLVSMHWF